MGVASENIVALRDVSVPMLNAAAAKFPVAKKFTGFRKLFGHASDLAAVVVATPEHTRAAATTLALRHGKHVHREKPLTHDIRPKNLAAMSIGSP